MHSLCNAYINILISIFLCPKEFRSFIAMIDNIPKIMVRDYLD